MRMQSRVDELCCVSVEHTLVYIWHFAVLYCRSVFDELRSLNTLHVEVVKIRSLPDHRMSEAPSHTHTRAHTLLESSIQDVIGWVGNDFSTELSIFIPHTTTSTSFITTVAPTSPIVHFPKVDVCFSGSSICFVLLCIITYLSIKFDTWLHPSVIANFKGEGCFACWALVK